MNTIQISVAISASLVALWIAYTACRKRLTLNRLSDLLTVYGVVLAVVVIFQFSPQLIEVTPTPRLVIHSVHAVRELDQHANIDSWTRRTGMPAAYCEGRVSNIGNALAFGRALAIASGTILSNAEPYRIFVAYLFDDGAHPVESHRASLNWQSQDQAQYLEPVGSQWILRLPPIPPNSSIRFVIGFRASELRADSETQIMNSILTNGLDLALVQAPSESVLRTHLRTTFKELRWVTTDCPYPPPREP